jgi:hypothetical protein
MGSYRERGYRDYHMVFFISDPLSALCPDISAREPVQEVRYLAQRTCRKWELWIRFVPST